MGSRYVDVERPQAMGGLERVSRDRRDVSLAYRPESRLSIHAELGSSGRREGQGTTVDPSFGPDLGLT